DRAVRRDQLDLEVADPRVLHLGAHLHELARIGELGTLRKTDEMKRRHVRRVTLLVHAVRRHRIRALEVGRARRSRAHAVGQSERRTEWVFDLTAYRATIHARAIGIGAVGATVAVVVETVVANLRAVAGGGVGTTVIVSAMGRRASGSGKQRSQDKLSRHLVALAKVFGRRADITGL